VGQAPEDLLWRPCYEVWRDRSQACEDCPVQRTLRTGRASEGEVLSPEGRDWLIKSHPVRSPDGELEGVAEVTLDITSRKRGERLAGLRLGLIEYAANHASDELLTKALDEIGAFLDSPLGFYHFVHEDQKTLTLQQWSSETLEHSCRAEGKGVHYAIDQAGVWVDCVRQGRAVIHNDYPSLPHRRGLPQGHAPVVRELVVPVWRQDRIAAIVGVGNKPAEYTEQDAQNLEHLADVVHEIVQRKLAEEALRSSESHYRAVFQTTGAATIIIEEDTTISLANANFEELSGYSRREVEGRKSWTDFMHSEDVGRMREYHYLRRRDPEAAPSQYEHRFLDRGGRERHILISVDIIPGTSRSVASLMDITGRKQSEEKTEHLNRVLAAIRNVNQLITTEKDRTRLIRGGCDKLTETRGYGSAWIALLDKAGRYSIRASSGLEDNSSAGEGDLDVGWLPECAREALDRADVVTVSHPWSQCGECLRRDECSGTSVFTAPLLHQSKVHGVMSVTLPRIYAEDEDERELVREVAGDIAFALHDIDLEEDRVRAEVELMDSERFLRSTLDGLTAHIAVLDQRGGIVLVNRAWRDFAEANGIPAELVSEGTSYLSACSQAQGDFSEGADAFARGIEEVVSGKRDLYSLEYPCPSPDRERWFVGRVSPFGEEIPRRVVVSHWDITERKQAERALRESEASYRDLFNNSPVGIHLTDSDGRAYYANPEMARMLGAFSPEELLQRFSDFSKELYLRPERRGELISLLREQGETENFEFEARRLDGGRIWMSLHARIREWLTEDDFLIDGFAVDITERKMAEEALRRKSEEQALLLESVPTQIWYLTDVETYGAVNQAHADFNGLPREEMEFRQLWDFLPREEAKVCREGNIQVFSEGRAIRTEEWLHDASGEKRLIEIVKTPKLDGGGNVEYVVCAGADITERKLMEEKLREMSLHDGLTGLYNRSFFEEELCRLAAPRYRPLGMIVCDLNGLKLINDTMGHTWGDHLLRAFAGMLRRCFRGSDVLARIGGDEFAVLLPESDLGVARECVQRIRREVEEHNQEGTELDISVAIGFAADGDTEADPQQLFKRADDVMYKEKLQQSYSSRSATVQALIKTLEARDFITDGHAGRMHHYVLELGRALSLSEDKLHDLQILARFHDLGKVGIPDHILFKPGRLTEEEFEEMKRHCEIGHRIALATSDLAPVADYILKHHEWWDGRGYPLGIQGEEIPLECRILSIVDAYDAMTSERPYKGAMSHEEAVRELRRCAGTQFDPRLVEEFIQLLARSGD